MSKSQASNLKLKLRCLGCSLLSNPAFSAEENPLSPAPRTAVPDRQPTFREEVSIYFLDIFRKAPTIPPFANL